MHADEVHTDVALVRRLLAGQFPHWVNLPVVPVDSYGTDHDIYRLGGRLSVRLPRIAWAAGQAAKEAAWLPRLAPHLPLAVPVPLALGRPGEGYPFDWSVCQWLPGADANGTIADLEQAAVNLAGFVRALQKVDTTGAHPRPAGGRAGRWPSMTSSAAAQSSSSPTGSTGRRSYARGRSRCTRRPGTGRRCGCMVTCCRATCWWSMGGCRR
jgi:aminoglycoside phosphotransferase (APT) family kinase protein